jgi:hypothetical protein
MMQVPGSLVDKDADNLSEAFTGMQPAMEKRGGIPQNPCVRPYSFEKAGQVADQARED